MNQSLCNRRMARSRHGKIAVLTAFMLFILLGVLACALDLGWVTMTKTQLRAATDSGALGGGTELLPGLGLTAFKTPVEVAIAARAEAVRNAGNNRAGDQPSVYVDAFRDVTLGQARMNTTTGQWEFTWGAAPYNAVQVVGRRDVPSSTNGDGPLPLYFAPALGINDSELDVLSTAVILPASGIRIPPDSGLTSGLTPFALKREIWAKRFRAQTHFENVLGSDPSLINSSYMDDGPEGDGLEMYFEREYKQNGTYDLVQVFDDAFAVVDPALHTPDNIISAQDGVLELNLYPKANEPGNFGTVDVGTPANETPTLERQILSGPSEEDMSYFENNQINPSENDPLILEGDTGISAGIKDEILAIIGQCRSILLYEGVNLQGNNAEYNIVDMVGTRWMYSDLTGNPKYLIIQPCTLSDPAGIPDFDEDIGEDHTMFTPLILAQ